MNKVFKVIWNEARNAYVVVSEIAKNHGSKSSSTKKLLAMLIATGVMTCASFDVLAAQPVAETTAAQQYVALKAVDFTKGEPTLWNRDSWKDSFKDLAAAKKEWNAQQNREKQIDEYKYTYDSTNKYWVRDGYVLTVDKEGGKYTPLSANKIRADVAYKDGVTEGILQSVTSTVSANGTVTNMGESLNKVTAGSFAGVSHSGGTAVAGSWNYIIQDSSWKNEVDSKNYANGYVDLIGNTMPKGFITAESNKGLVWDNNKQAYTYQGKAVDYSNVYVIDGKIGVFTNKEGTKVYTGTVYGRNNEILMTVKDGDKFYSYWAAQVTDQSTTMATYRVEDYKKDLAVLEENDNKLSRDDIKKVTLDTSKANSATIGLLRNGDKAVDGAITVTSGGGTGGKDTFVNISNAKDTEGKTFATGSKVEVNGPTDAITGIKVNGVDYTIKQGSGVKVTQDAANKTTTITVDGTPTTITDTDTHNALASATLDGNKTLTITGQDNDSVSVDLSSIDTDTKYTAGNGIAIDNTNKNAISVKLKEGDANLVFDDQKALSLNKNLTVDSVNADNFFMNKTTGIGYDGKAYITSTGLNANSQKITGVAAGDINENSTDAVNGSQLHATNKKVEELNGVAGKHTTLVNGTNTTVKEIGDGANGKQYQVNVKLDDYAKTQDVAVVYVDNNKNKSLHTTNSGSTVGSNAIALGNGANAHDNSVVIGDGAYTQKGGLLTGSGYSVALGNNAVTGTKSTSVGYKAIGGRVGTITVGYNSYNGAAYGTVIGTESKINYRDKKTANAAATIVGAQSEIIADDKPYSGVANGIFGSANKIQNSNGVTIQGSGNTVTNAYKDMSGRDFSLGGVFVKKDAGAVGVIGGMNTVSNQIYTNVIGFGNTVAGAADNISHDVFVAGSRNNLSKVSDSIVMGNDNTISDRSNVISFGHNNTISANNAVAIGNGAGVSVAGGVALGVDSVANRVAGRVGYDPTTDAEHVIPKDDAASYVWKATKGAVSVGSARETRQITNVAAGTEDTDAVNVAQLKTAKTEVQAGANITSVDKTTGANGQDVYTINAKDTTYAAGNGITISGDNNAISVKLKEGENNLDVTADGLALKKDLTVNSVKADKFFMDSTKGVGYDGKAYITSNGLNANGQKITGVAQGTADTDAVNYGQLKNISAAATAAKTEIKGGTNIAKVDQTTAADGHMVYTVNADGTTVSGDSNVVVTAGEKDANNVTNYGVKLNKDLKGIESISNGDAKINLNDTGVVLSKGNDKSFSITDTGMGMSVIGDDYQTKSIMVNKTGTVISGGLSVENSKITNVAAGEADTDAVNVRQLKGVETIANKGWNLTTAHGETTTVKPGDTVDFSPEDTNLTVTNDGTNVKIGLNQNVHLTSATFGDTIIKSNGLTIGSGTSGLEFSKDRVSVGGQQIHDVEAGQDDMDAVNVSQLNKVKETANKGWNLSTNGGEAAKVAPGETVDFTGDENISVNNTGKNVTTTLNKNLKGIETIANGPSKVVLNEGYAGMAYGNTNIVLMNNGVYLNGKVNVDKAGQIHNVTAGTADNDAVNVSQLNKETAASKTTVSDGINTTVTSTIAEDGHTDYKVNLNKDLKGIESISNGDAKIKLNDKGVVISKGNDKTFSITDTGMGMSVIGDDYVTRSIMVGKTGTVISGGLSVAGSKITNVAAGTDDTDAVNVSQLKGVETIANKGWNLTTGVVTDATQVKPGDTVDFSGDKNISVSHKGTDVSIALKDTLTLGSNATDGYVTVDGVKGTVWAGHAVSAGNVNMDGDSGEIMGLTNTTLNSKDFATTGRAATEEQLKLVKNQADSAATEASKHSKVVNGSNITVEETDQDGQKTYKVGLNKNLEGIESISNGDAKINLNDTGVVISKGKDKTFSITDTGMGMSVIGDDYVTRSIMIGKTGTVISGGLSVAGSKITNVAAGEADTDAVNVGQLNAAVSKGNTDTHIDYSKDYTVGADNKVSMDVVNKNGDKIGNVTIKDVAKASDLGDVSKIADDIKNKKGNTTVVDAVNNVNKKVGDLNYSNVEKGYIKDGDSSTTAIGKLNQKLSDVEQTAGKHSSVSAGDSNINVDGSGKNDAGGIDYKVSLNKDLKLDSVTTGATKMDTDGVKVGENVSLTKDGLTAGDTKVTNDGLSIDGKTYVSKDGLNANDNKVTGVKDGDIAKGSTDAVNGGQLYETNQAIANNATNISSLSHSISNLDNRVNKVGAGAAALAALHPLDFDPDAKWDFAAGYGNYRGTNAAAVGAYYRPNEDTMFSVGGTFGNGENMVNAGVSFKLGSGSSHVSTSRVAMAKEIKELRGELEAMKSAMLDANAGKKIDTSKLQLFPDVPQNHWAYEYVAQLAGNGMIEGYPDGNFAGDRPMTRYEFAAILYRAMTKGAVLSDKILSEFSHELEYFTVDTVAKDKAGNPTIQRVRTVKENINK